VNALATAVIATFSPADGILKILGDAGANTIVVSRDAAGTIFVNNGAVAITGGSATVANVKSISINGGDGNRHNPFDETNGAVAITGGSATVANVKSISINGGDGNDNISLDETNGALPIASLVGGNGNDTLTGGSHNDTLEGGGGNDMLTGKAGSDTYRFDT